jgi:hypothetical protein
MALYHWTPFVTNTAKADRLRFSRDGAQVLERFQPSGDAVPTGAVLVHQLQFADSRA